MYYGFAYLTMEQMYKCQYASDGPFVTCSAENDICPALASDEAIEYRVDTSYEYYLNNWYVQMDLVCANTAATNSMISAKYVMYGVAGLLFFAMPDRFGRKSTMMFWMTVHLAAQILLLIEPNYWARFAGLVIYGLAQMKQSVVYVWA